MNYLALERRQLRTHVDLLLLREGALDHSLRELHLLGGQREPVASKRYHPDLVEDVKLVLVVFVEDESQELAGSVDVNGSELADHPFVLAVVSH